MPARIWIPLVLVLVGPAAPRPQRPSDQAQKAVGEAFKLQADGKYMAAIAALENDSEGGRQRHQDC